MIIKNKKLVKLLENDFGPMTFAGFLRGARASKDLSQVEMAQMLEQRWGIPEALSSRRAMQAQTAERIHFHPSLAAQIDRSTTCCPKP